MLVRRPPHAEDPTRKAPLAPWVLAVLAAAVHLVATRHGPGLTNDSVTYLATGVNIADGRGITMLDGSPLTTLPPGLPLVAALGEIAGVGAQTAVRGLNAVCAALIVILGHRLLRTGRLRPEVLWSATALLAISPAVLGITEMAWSESAFMVLVALFLLAAQRIRRTGLLSAADLISLAGICWTAFLFRYAATALIAAAVVIVAAALPRKPASFVTVGLLAAGSSAFPAAWMVRNHVISGTWMGPRLPSPDSLDDVLRQICGTVGLWIVPVPGALGKSIALPLLGISLSIAVVYVLFRTAPDGHTGGRRGASVYSTAAIFVSMYLAFMVFAQLSAAIDVIASRLLSPVYLPMVFLASVALSAVLDRLEPVNEHRVALGVIGVALSLLTVGQIIATVQRVWQGVTDGVGYNAERWRHSGVATEMNQLPDISAYSIYSNNAQGLWAASGRQPLLQSPRFAVSRNLPISGELQRFESTAGCSERPVLLVMFNDGDRRAYSVGQLAGVVDLIPVAEATDGNLFRVRTRSPVDTGDCAAAR